MKKLILICLTSFALIASVKKPTPQCFAGGAHEERIGKLSKYFFARSGFIKNEALEDAYIEAMKTSKSNKAPGYITVMLNDPAKYNVTEEMLKNIEKYTGEKIDFSSLPSVGVIYFSFNKDNIETIEKRTITGFASEKNKDEDSIETKKNIALLHLTL